MLRARFEHSNLFKVNEPELRRNRRLTGREEKKEKEEEKEKYKKEVKELVKKELAEIERKSAEKITGLEGKFKKFYY